ncbi:hypothetical protein D3C85_1745190 [compost metagenome]
MALKKIDHLWALFEERFHALVEHFAAQFMAQVNPRLFQVFNDTVGDGQRVARNPQPTARPGAGAAQLRLLLHHDDVEAQLRSSHRRCQARGARADDQNITK